MRLEMSFRYRLSGHSERVYDAPRENRPAGNGFKMQRQERLEAVNR